MFFLVRFGTGGAMSALLRAFVRSLLNFDQVPDFKNHAASSRVIRALDNLLHAAEAQAPNGLPHITRAANETNHPLDPDGPTVCFLSGV